MWPNKIQIDGKVMHGMFQGKTDFVQNAIDALVRLYQQMDTEMYSRWNEKRWRHFLTTDFAVRSRGTIYTVLGTMLQNYHMAVLTNVD